MMSPQLPSLIVLLTVSETVLEELLASVPPSPPDALCSLVRRSLIWVGILLIWYPSVVVVVLMSVRWLVTQLRVFPEAMVLTWWIPEFAEDLETTPNRLTLVAPVVRALL